ncbi:MAG: acetyl-CoA C-acyltransferase, partial [Gammaproteobacteria bacterium]|nr:acetyl-CoA C-acyltransferase [Gammaproteobacteria bacterium]
MLVGSNVRRVAIVGGARIPFARAHGAYSQVGNQRMLTAAIQGVVSRFKLDGKRLGEVAAGAVIKHSCDFNLARESVLGTTLDPHTPAYDLQRACGTSLEAANNVANKIALGQIDCAIAGGVDTVSDPPIVYPRGYQQILMRAFRAKSLGGRLAPFLSLRPHHFKPAIPSANEPRTGLSMGESCELMAKRWGITRAAQDELAYESHRRAAAAWQAGFFADLVVPFEGLSRDDNVRADSSTEKLSKLKSSFDRTSAGTLTAGNSTPLTDGASAVLLASEDWAHAHGLPVQAWLTFGKAAAVDFVTGNEGLLMAPAYAVPAMLDDAGLT